MSENDGLEQIPLSRNRMAIQASKLLKGHFTFCTFALKQGIVPNKVARSRGPHLHEFPLASEPRFGRASDSMEDKETELLNSMSLSSYACYPSAR